MTVHVFLNNPITKKTEDFCILNKQFEKEVDELKIGTTFFYDGSKYKVQYIRKYSGDYYIYIDPIIEKEFHIIQY